MMMPVRGVRRSSMRIIQFQASKIQIRKLPRHPIIFMLYIADTCMNHVQCSVVSKPILLLGL
jgi:hypothetical protein